MIGGITKGSCFSGCVEYALALKEKNKEARLLYSEGLMTDTPKDIIDGFECQRHLNSRGQHWCGHISLSYSLDDSARLSDEVMVKLALEYMEKTGIKATDYAGEIGEEAFKAIMLHYTDCTEDNFRHLEGLDYELADFIVTNDDGSYRIAFDVKNMNPRVNNSDKAGRMLTSDKREAKRKRLGCELITVNMLHISSSGMDEIREIGGVIYEDGRIVPSAIETLRKLVSRNGI